MSMGDSHGHGGTTCAYEGVNEVNFRVIAQYSASGSSSKLFNLVSSPIASLFPSFRIHGIVVINRLHRLHRLQRLQSSPELHPSSIHQMSSI
jgi:hypothetical protein